MNRNLVGNRFPCGTSRPANIARSAVTYSRISATGCSMCEPNQFSTVTWCDTPMPSTIRPPEYSSIVAACWAVATGVRECIGSTPVPSRIRSVAAAYAIRTVSESRPAMWVT